MTTAPEAASTARPRLERILHAAIQSRYVHHPAVSLAYAALGWTAGAAGDRENAMNEAAQLLENLLEVAPPALGVASDVELALPLQRRDARLFMRNGFGTFDIVASRRSYAIADFIARASNAHNDLVDALQAFVRDTEITLRKIGYTQQQIDTTPNFVDARAALAKAGVKP